MAKQTPPATPRKYKKPYDPYYPTDYKIGAKKKGAQEVPMYPTERVATFKQWVGIFFVSMIPLINIIALIAWSNKKNAKVNDSVRNYAKASLMWISIFYVLGIIGTVVCSLVLHLF